MENSNNFMLEGFGVRRFPDWEKVGYEKFDVGYFSHGLLNGYAKKYILEAVFENNKKVAGYERITIGYFEDDKLNGLGIKIEDNEIIEYGFYHDDRLIDIDRVMHDSPAGIIDNFIFNDMNQGEASYFGECLNNRRGTGRGVVIDRKDRMIFANFVDNRIVPGLYIMVSKGKVSFNFITYDEKSKNVANILLNNEYRPPIEDVSIPKGDFGCVGRDEEAQEGYFDENGLMQGLGFRFNGRESGYYQDDKLIFGSVDFDTDSTDLEEIIKNKHMLIPSNLKIKKMKYKEGVYIGEIKDGVPHGFGRYFYKTARYQELMDMYEQRELRNILIGNTKNIPEDIKYGDACYIATFFNGKMEGYCTRWIYTSNKFTVNYFWQYDEGILAYKDRFRPDMTLYEYYTLKMKKMLKPRVSDKSPFDFNNHAYTAYFLKQRLIVDDSSVLLYPFNNAFYFAKENTQNDYELWIFLTEEDNANYEMCNDAYVKNLISNGYKQTGDHSFLQNSGLYEITMIDEGRNVRISIRKNFR